VIVTDDGIATGSTMLAVLDVIRGQRPRERIVAVPICSPDRIAVVRRCCDELVHLVSPENFSSVGAAYTDFRQVSDEEVREVLRQFGADRDGVKEEESGGQSFPSDPGSHHPSESEPIETG
jgi:putative phosphoribosyl transferase